VAQAKESSPSAPGTTSLDWTDTDALAVDVVRGLAMDAVEAAGNGHPGTAMSLAPAAYLLFQRLMRHDPTDPTNFRRKVEASGTIVPTGTRLEGGAHRPPRLYRCTLTPDQLFTGPPS
jgi:hypothetical protein